jgi:hypothetical protein
MATALESFLTALHQRLSNHAPLAARISGVFDNVPTRTAFPYLMFGDTRVTDASTATTTIQRIELPLSILSDAAGRSETLSLQADIETALATALTLNTEWRCALLTITSASAQTRDNGRLRRTTLRLDAWIEKT